MIVVCGNDFPEVILPEGTTAEQANEYVKERQVERNKQFEKTNSALSIYVHWHECPVVDKV